MLVNMLLVSIWKKYIVALDSTKFVRKKKDFELTWSRWDRGT